MPKKRQTKQTAKSGITHFTLEEEQDRQEKVHQSASDKGEAPPSSKPSLGHRMSRYIEPPSAEKSDERFHGKGGKGGKTRGSRAGLLSASRKVQKNRKSGPKLNRP